MRIARATSRWVAVATIAAIVTAGCSSRAENDDDKSSRGAEVTSKALTQPTALPVTEAVKGDLPEDAKIVYLYNGIDQSTSLLNGMKAAAEALGWTFEPFTYDPTNPATFGTAAQSAVASKPDVLVTTALVKAQLDPVLAMASKAGIPVIDTLSSNEASEGHYPIFRTPVATAYAADLLAEQILADADGKPVHVAESSVPQFVETLGVVTERVKAALEDCSECTHDTVDISVPDVFNGKYVSQITSFLQRKQDVTVLVSNVAQLDLGMDAALQQAGLDGITRYGVGPSEAQVSALQNGGAGAWAMYPLEVIGWAIIDTSARIITGDTSNPWSDATLSYVVNKTNAQDVDAKNPEFPAGYQGMFKTLWKLS